MYNLCNEISCLIQRTLHMNSAYSDHKNLLENNLILALHSFKLQNKLFIIS